MGRADITGKYKSKLSLIYLKSWACDLFMEDPRVITLSGKKMLSLVIIASLTIAIVYTYVVALLAFVAPSETFPLEVVQLDTLDFSNATASSFNQGDKVRVNITVEMAHAYYVNFPISYYYTDFLDDTSYRVIVTIMDPNKMPVFFASDINTVYPSGVDVYIYDYTVSGSASLGEYTVRVMVWSDWLPGGLALSELAKEVTIDVV